MPERRCNAECDSYISENTCNFEFEYTLPIKKRDLYHRKYSKEKIEIDRKNRAVRSINIRALLEEN